MSQTRQLAAIMFTDIVGYTALMGKDEQKAMELLKVNRDIQKHLIEEYNGKWLKEMGDGTLVSFPSASEAVFCALKIQEGLKDKSDLNLRIGIHVGEIILEDGDVFGDGVNIASRLESLAPTGGIWISESVNSNIKNKQGIETKFIREQHLKNVDEPVRVYEVKVKGTEFSKTIATSLPHKGNQDLLTKRKVVLIALVVVAVFTLIYFFYLFNHEQGVVDEPITIAVLAFDDQSPDGDQEWLGDGMADEILNVLTKVDGLQVTGKTSSFSFKGKGLTTKAIGETLNVKTGLEGSVSRIGDVLRITAQLIDVETDAHIWSKKYDRDAADIFSIMDEVAQNIARSLVSELSIEELENIKVGYKVDPEAYEYFLKGEFFHWRFLNRGSIDAFEQAERMFIKAISIDPTYAEAYAGLADVYDSNSKLDNIYEGKRDSVISLGYMINPNSAYILGVKAFKFTNSNGKFANINYDSAFYFFKKSLSIDSTNTIINTVIGQVFGDIGLCDNAISIFNKILLTDPLNTFIRSQLAVNLLRSGNYKEAKVNYEKVLEIDPNNTNANGGLFFIASCYDKDIIEATRILEKLKALYPKREYRVYESRLLAMDGKKEEALSLFCCGLVNYCLLNMKKEALNLIDSLTSVRDYTEYPTYIYLLNSPQTDFIKEEPAFKEVLAKGKIVHEERVRKYGHLFDE